ncbi:hypothetical protein E7T09_04550 [Deinococcus sp. KSM4-11]|uniref:hypothetical protein n=1 Tax=Deinococcus sp. KSM4-11 TaxID=2568654 RepID=UPI0010A3BFE5|nr:hypothetical protein [Deinococcus sp. KSM4-11]THF88481.1 hypothetical protein E7T09_04550 [Deinococcus sp. KSM4-11]
MSGTPTKSPTKRSTKNPGAARFNQLYSKRKPGSINDLTDRELLVILLGSPQAADTVLEHIGEISQYSRIGEGGSMTHRPGIGKGVALKLDALFEFACRVG